MIRFIIGLYNLTLINIYLLFPKKYQANVLSLLLVVNLDETISRVKVTNIERLKNYE